MKKIFIFLALGILLTSFAFAGITGSASANAGMNNQASSNQSEKSEIKIQEKNRLRINEGECTEGCTCTGSSTKCQLQNGREITITAGNSGNIIVQVKGEEIKTRVQLYKEGERLYGQFRNNQTKEIKAMPDQVKQKVQEKLQLRNCSCEIELNEDGNYQTKTQKRAKLFGFISVKETSNIEIDATTGEIKRIRNSWWGFLAKDIEEELIVGASCGTVTPGQNDACCQDKDYDYWDSEKGECLFE